MNGSVRLALAFLIDVERGGPLLVSACTEPTTTGEASARANAYPPGWRAMCPWAATYGSSTASYQ